MARRPIVRPTPILQAPNPGPFVLEHHAEHQDVAYLLDQNGRRMVCFRIMDATPARARRGKDWLVAALNAAWNVEDNTRRTAAIFAGEKP